MAEYTAKLDVAIEMYLQREDVHPSSQNLKRSVCHSEIPLDEMNVDLENESVV